ncbi:hypothetical protein CEDDRAFT_03956 [Frankia sp. CeD]|nr:hypothetical protein BMG523Draft_03525 [Frankia sp. BMG5.23]KEZ34705.1 hypothetical protein CEDDRAFT_03956 [Frankia sp. CeD]
MVLLRAYTPKLNPAEGAWSQLKRTAVVNLTAARTLDEVC